jgi:hypothetical protein
MEVEQVPAFVKTTGWTQNQGSAGSFLENMVGGEITDLLIRTTSQGGLSHAVQAYTLNISVENKLDVGFDYPGFDQAGGSVNVLNATVANGWISPSTGGVFLRRRLTLVNGIIVPIPVQITGRWRIIVTPDTGGTGNPSAFSCAVWALCRRPYAMQRG